MALRIVIFFLFLRGAISLSAAPSNTVCEPLDLTEMKWIELTQEGERYLADPMLVAVGQTVSYVYDRKLLAIAVLKENRLDSFVGQTGQGPGELFQPVAIKLFGDRLYILNRNLRMLSVAEDGSIREKESMLKKGLSGPYVSVSDFDYFENCLCVSIMGGKDRLLIIDERGQVVQRMLSDERLAIVAKGLYHTQPCSLIIDESRARGIVLNCLNGLITWIDMRRGSVLAEKQIQDRKLEQINKDIQTREKNQKTHPMVDIITLSLLWASHSRGADSIVVKGLDSDNTVHFVPFDSFEIVPKQVILKPGIVDFHLIRTVGGYWFTTMRRARSGLFNNTRSEFYVSILPDDTG